MFPTPDVGRDPVNIGYLLPEEPEGHPLRCVSFLIPDTQEYRAALYRQVYNLGVTETWDRADPHKAMLASEVWTGALQSSFRIFEDGCVMAITAIRIDGCNLEVQIDESDDWVVIGDMTACVIAAAPTPTIVRQDITPPGNMQQSIDGAAYTDIANTDFLWRNGQWPMTGGLEINNIDAQPALRIQPDAAQVGNYSAIEQRNKLGQTLVTWSYVGQFTMYDPVTPTRYIQFAQAPGGNGFLTKNGAGQLLIFADSTIAMQFGQEQGVAIGSTAQSPLAMLSVWSKTTSQIALALRGVTGQTLDMMQCLNVAAVKLAAITAAGSAIISEKIDLQRASSTARRDVATMQANWDDSTDATRKGRFELLAHAYNGSREIIRGRNDSAAAMVGFLGATPSPRLAISGDHRKNPMTKQIVEALALFGLVTDNTTDTSVLTIVGERQGYALMAELLTDLETYSNGGIVDATSEGTCLLVCEEEPPEFWCKVYDFTTEIGRAGWSLERGVVGGGFESTLSDSMVFIHRGESQNFLITDVTIDYELSGSSDGTCIIGNYDFTDTVQYDFGTIDAGAHQLLAEFTPEVNFVGFRIVIVSNDPFQEMSLLGVKINGYDLGLYDVMGNGEACP